MASNSAYEGISLAVNAYDIDRIDVDTRRGLLSGRLDLQSPVLWNYAIILVNGVRSGDPTEIGLPFNCDLLSAAKIVDAIRAYDLKQKLTPTRIYLQRKTKGDWQRLTGNTLLTEKVRGKVRLSAKLFPVGISPMDTTPSSENVSL